MILNIVLASREDKPIEMLLFYVLILSTIGVPIYGGVIQDHHEDKSFTKKAEIYFKKRCLNNEEQLEHIVRELNEIDDCLKKILPSHTEDDDEELEEKCFERRKEVLGCMQKLVDLLEPCLPPEEKYLPEFVLESFGGFSEYLCKHIHVLTMDGLLETKMVKCINRFTRYKGDSPHYICYESAKFGNHSHDAPILKEELCEDLDFVYHCYERQFKEHCPDAPKAWEFQAGLLNGLRSPCREKDGQGGGQKDDQDKGQKDDQEEEDEEEERRK